MDTSKEHVTKPTAADPEVVVQPPGADESKYTVLIRTINDVLDVGNQSPHYASSVPIRVGRILTRAEWVNEHLST